MIAIFVYSAFSKCVVGSTNFYVYIIQILCQNIYLISINAQKNTYFINLRIRDILILTFNPSLSGLFSV